MARGSVRGARHWCFGVALGVLFGLAGPDEAPAGEVGPAAARWVSADAVVVLEMAKPAALIDRLTDERLRGPLSSIPAVKAALESNNVRQIKDVADRIAGKLGKSPEEALRDLTGGGLVVAAEVEEGKPPRFFLIMTPSDPTLLGKTNEILLDLARKDATEKGKADPIERTDYRGVTGYSAGPKGVYAIVKDRLVIGDRGETARAVIDRALDGMGAKGSFADTPEWSSRRAAVRPDTLAWGFARLERLRKLDPKRYGGDGGAKRPPQETILLGGWVEAVRKAPWVEATFDWGARRMAAELILPVPPGGRGGAFRGFVPPEGSGSGAPALAKPPGMIASLSLWRDLSAVWESRADLLTPEAVQGLAKLDTFAGQFFGGRDFGTGVLGALTSDWRLVLAMQDHAAMSPVPDVKLPAFALVVDVRPDDDDFAARLKVAFQSFVGLANLGAAQSKAPPLELGSETFEGVTISTTRFMAPAKKVSDGADAKGPVHVRHNFSPSAAQVGGHFVLSSSLGLARDLVKSLKSPGKPDAATLAVEAEGAALAGLVDLNRDRLVLQSMLKKGHDKDQAEAEVEMLASLLRYLGHGRLSIEDRERATRVGLEFSLGK